MLLGCLPHGRSVLVRRVPQTTIKGGSAMRRLHMLLAIGSLVGCDGPPDDVPVPMDVPGYFKDLPGWAPTHPLRDEYHSSDKETDLGTGAVMDRPADATMETRPELLDGVLQNVQY